METTVKLPKETVSAYRVEILDNVLHIHEPAYIHIDIDEQFDIEDTEFVYRISNSKVTVGLWKKIRNMHITVY